MSFGFGGGNAWLNDHKKILDHARGLHYDHVPGVTLPSAVDPDDYTEEDKQEWISAMDAFNAWKAREIPKEQSGQAWWQTYTESQDASSSSKKSGEKSGNLLDNNPKENVYFPMLVPEYTSPSAQDWSAYMPRVGPYDAPIPNLGVEGGLFYQPWSTEYQQAFVPSNIWNYTPPQLNVGSPTFSGTPATGLLEVVHPEPETSPTNTNDGSLTDGNPDSIYGNRNLGTGVNVAGYITGSDGKTYGVDHNGMVIGFSGYPSVDLTAAHNPQQSLGTTVSNAVANLLGINVPTISIPEYSMEDLLGPSSITSGVDPDPTPSPHGDDGTFGLGIAP